MQGQDDKKKVTQHAKYTADQYKTIKNIGIGSERLASKILPVRDFNNWAKTALIQLAFSQLKDQKNIAVLDLCSGKGGDLNKYFKLKGVSYYTGIDITLESQIEAMKRYNETLQREKLSNQGLTYKVTQQPYQADFVLADVTCVDLSKHFTKAKYDIISCQFALHYAFINQESANNFFKNIKSMLNRNGCFIAIFPCKDTIYKRLQEKGYNDSLKQNPPQLGNDIYKITFPRTIDFKDNLFGQAYNFSLNEAVDDTTEYLIDMRDFKELCTSHQLQIVHEFPSLEVLVASDKIPEKAKHLLSKMMTRTAKFNYLLRQKQNQKKEMNDEDFWNDIDEEKIDNVDINKIKPITDINQIHEQYLEVIRFYQAVVIQHHDKESQQEMSRIKIKEPIPRRLVDLVNLTDTDIQIADIHEKYKDKIWEPIVDLSAQ